MAAREGIEHVVVLMLENRSFDCMFGQLYPKSSGFEGLSGIEFNPYHAANGVVNIPVWNDTGIDPATAAIPDPDPGESFADMNAQLFGQGAAPTDEPPPMSGFVDNYMSQPPSSSPPREQIAVMHYFTEKQVPVISELAKAFGVSDQWHASAPCQTWPNRFFVHAGTAGGHTDNNLLSDLPFSKPTIFRRLADEGRSWKVYFHDMPQAATLADLWFAFDHFSHFEDAFEKDASSGSLPNYSFIEPAYFANGDLGLIPSDQHPPHNIVYGEQLIARVYNAVRAAPTWKKSLLIITYDEHGGCFDHVSPPTAVSPDGDLGPDGFKFVRYGVRVPAVIISPYMPPGKIVRSSATKLPHRGPPYPYDHTSILATLRELFELGAPLTARDAAAPGLLEALSLEEPTNDGPLSISATGKIPTDGEMAVMEGRSPNDMQRSLCELATRLPATPEQAAAHVTAPARGVLTTVTPELPDTKSAAAYVTDQTKALWRRN
jgi:phospholipase C